MAMEEDVDALRWFRRRDVNEAAADSVSLRVDSQRPFKIGVAIAPNESQRRSNVFQPNDQTGFANVTQMPDLIHIVGECFEIVWEVIVRVSQNEDPQRFAIHPRAS